MKDRSDTAMSRILYGVLILLICGLALIVFLAVPRPAHAEGTIVSDACTIRWNASTGNVAGYRVYVGTSSTSKTQRAQVTGTTADCADLSLTEGQNYVHVTSYNIAGESGASGTVPFVVVTAAPGVPTGLQVLP